MTDPIADMLTRIRNALMARKPEVLIPYSTLKFSIAKILEVERFVQAIDRLPVGNARRRGKTPHLHIRVRLRYGEQGRPVIRVLERVSKPGRRVYCKYLEIPRVQNDYGIAILSTPKGVMTSREAKKQKVGGEVLCKVW